MTKSDSAPDLEQRRAFLDDLVKRRGFVRPSHKLLVEYDIDTMRAMDALANTVYLKQRRLDRKTKELIFITSMVCLRLPKSYVQTHIKVALEHGVSREEILEAIELVIPEAGFPAFTEGLSAWAEAVGAKGIEPSQQAYEEGQVRSSS